ncbi:response regulator [bacterium]|nr:response regulator [bacterium]
MPDTKVLIVEDEGIIAKDIESTLLNLDYKVVDVVSSGEDSIKSAMNNRPDIVLMDIVLQGKMNGIQAAKQIRKELDIPVIYLTAYADNATLQKAKLSEPFGYILKPFEDKEVHSVIEMALYKHKMERKLRENEKKFRNLVEGIDEAVFRLSLPDGNYEYFSPGAKHVFGYDNIEFIKNPEFFFDIIHTEFKKPLKKSFTNMKKGEIDPVFEYKIVGPDGSERWILQSNYGMKDDDDNIIAVEGICRDITKRKQAEEYLQSLNEQLEQMVEERTKELETAVANLEREKATLERVLEHLKDSETNIRQEVAKDFEQVLVPIISKVKSGDKDTRMNLVGLLEEGIKELASSPLTTLSEYSKLSQREIEICDLIKNGYRSEEIADGLGISVKTVHKHRHQIRKKLGILKEKVNLRSYLLGLSQK